METFTSTAWRRGSAYRVLARLRSPLGVYTVPLVVLVLWQLASSSGWIAPEFAASPVQIYSSAVGLWRAGEQAFNGVVQILNTVPLLALLPLMIVWFGIGEESKVLLIALGAGVPIYLNLFAAIRGVDRGLIEMAVAAGAGRWRLIRRLLLPGALPGLLVGLRFALAYSVLGLVAAEQINADSGVGFMISQAQTYERVDEIYLGIVIYAVLGLLADQIVRVLERALLTWRPTYQGS